ncbi:hypothetical protein MPSEU_000305900 [Mayamaea pseudoterrestris]|nr:hypothetical protein MPSEU_000305900 [Mayamaea pseudoterrestris]
MLSSIIRRSTLRSLATRSFAAAAGQQLTQLTSQLPHLDVVRYEHKNRTWSLQHTDYYSDALAIGLLEFGLQTGDVVLSFLPEHLSEQMVLQFACSKSGFILYSLPPSPNPAALAKALELTKANVLISQEAGQDTNYISIVEQAVPELRIFDTSNGMPFVTPRFPHLRMCVHTGFDQDDKEGWFALRHLIVPTGERMPQVTNEKTPLAGSLVVDASGMPTKLGPTLSNAQVVSKGVWPTFSKVLKKEFHTVEGVGVIF